MLLSMKEWIGLGFGELTHATSTQGSFPGLPRRWKFDWSEEENLGFGLTPEWGWGSGPAIAGSAVSALVTVRSSAQGRRCQRLSSAACAMPLCPDSFADRTFFWFNLVPRIGSLVFILRRWSHTWSLLRPFAVWHTPCHPCGGQRTISGVRPHLRSCMRQPSSCGYATLAVLWAPLPLLSLPPVSRQER